ncbi:MAG TPA: hypothetical protein EYN67_14665 [Flavobacteriales bacterium]|nr:hypothetical protein [Flavobacteriales bacterium]
MSEMKVIMENWDKFVVTEETKITTVGDLRKAIKIYRAKEAGKEAGKMAADVAIQQVPGISNIYSLWQGAKDARDIMKKLYGADDGFKSNTGLDLLNVNDDISAIVDDNVETAFLNDLIASLESAQPTDPIPVVDDELQAFLGSKFNQHAVKK